MRDKNNLVINIPVFVSIWYSQVPTVKKNKNCVSKKRETSKKKSDDDFFLNKPFQHAVPTIDSAASSFNLFFFF